MTAFEILKQDIQEKKEEKKEIKKAENKKKEEEGQNKKQDKKILSGSIAISFSINPETGKYTFLYSINEITEAISTNSFIEGIEHITEMIKANGLKISEREEQKTNNKKPKENKPKQSKEKENEKQIASLFDL